MALPWLPPFPLLPLHGLPLPIAQGLPGGTRLGSAPFAPWTWPEAFPDAVSTIAPFSIRAVSAAGAMLPATTIRAAWAEADGGNASWATVGLAAMSNAP